MKKNLFLEAITKFLLGVALVGLLVFLPAGTLRFFGGWLLMAILFVPMLCAGLVMLKWNPSLLKSRLEAKEKRRAQDLVVKLSGLMFLIGFMVAGLDFRFSWLPLPDWVNWLAAALFLLAYLLYAEVLRENAYLSRTIEVQRGQTVVSTGLYGVVRHPMYSVTLLLFLTMPFVLGSALAFLCFLCYPVLIVKRLKDEEAFLEKELPGYSDYQKKVKYRLIPGIW